VRAKPAFSLVDVAADLGRMDEDLWNRLLVREGPLDLLLAPENPTPLQMPAGQLPQLVEFWRTLYDVVLLDLPGSHHDLSFTLARHADLLLLISTCELASVYSTARKSAYLESCGIRPGEIKAVLNRFRPAFPLESWGKIVGQPVFARVSEAGDTLQKVLLDGKPMPAHSKFGSDIAALARQLTGWALTPAQANKETPRRVQSGSGLFSPLLRALRPKPPCVLNINASD
jgi:pilus assembly protein CpaE